LTLFEDNKKDGLKLLPLIALSLIIGMYLGNRFPDIDQRTDLLTHRSILTHGFIIPLVLYLIVSRIENPITRFWGMGFNLAVSIHLCFDLFPKGWYMHALIHIPGIGWTWAFISQGWIFLSMVICIYTAFKLIKNFNQAILCMLGILLFFIYAHQVESNLFKPLIMLVIAIVIASGILVFKSNDEEYTL